MGDFFEDLGKRITETAGAVTKKTEEVVETQKIKSQIRVEERNKERDLQHLGKLVYDRFQKGEVIDTAFVVVVRGCCTTRGRSSVLFKRTCTIEGNGTLQELQRRIGI